MLELWGMWSTTSLPSLPGPLWPGEVASDRVADIYRSNCVPMPNRVLRNRIMFTFNCV